MVTSNDLKGIMAMMPAFTTKDGDRIDATDTVDTDELTRAVDKFIRDDGVNVLTTTGSFGEFHTLLWDEHKKLIEATVAAVKKRVPVFVGCTNLNPREAIRQAKFAQEAGADGLLLGVPFYYQATVDNAVQFYHDVADALPKMGVMIYHNPTHHRVTIPVGAFKKITEKPNIVGMKDSPPHAAAVRRAVQHHQRQDERVRQSNADVSLLSARRGGLLVVQCLDGTFTRRGFARRLLGSRLGSGYEDLPRPRSHQQSRAEYRQSFVARKRLQTFRQRSRLLRRRSVTGSMANYSAGSQRQQQKDCGVLENALREVSARERATRKIA